ncbi:ferric iron ABC transporter permease protein [Vibrio variabilis]|uniref:Ferric iron ABC transporter permease protein n=1 Tax=Vibrio variabilis TaxID=990271 RepID=A0ABQ0JDX3_9VIBR|nr:ferric iron ABC transporter permease protein [Vibrio variabilis]
MAGGTLNVTEIGDMDSIIGSVVIFIGAYCIEKGRAFGPVRQAMQMMSVIPMAVPGWYWVWVTSSTLMTPITPSVCCMALWHSWLLIP